MPNIRPAHHTDLETLAAIEAQCFPPAEGAGRDTLAGRLTHYPHHFLVLEKGEKIIGFINGPVTQKAHLADEMYVHPESHDETGDWQMIFGVDVLPDFRRQGYAARLLEGMIHLARQQGRKGLVLTCKEHLIHYYARFGFQDEGVSDSSHGGVQWHEMRLRF